MTAAAARDAGPQAIECGPPTRNGATRRTVRGYASGKQDYLRRLRKIEGQVRGLQKMIEADTWCPDVVTQVASATRALQEVAVGLLSDHLRHCVTQAVHSSPAEGDQALAEATGAIRQVVRL
jgi:CsoR family transcriptional regulator, copper-sensing transcriptional repressor